MTFTSLDAYRGCRSIWRSDTPCESSSAQQPLNKRQANRLRRAAGLARAAEQRTLERHKSARRPALNMGEEFSTSCGGNRYQDDDDDQQQHKQQAEGGVAAAADTCCDFVVVPRPETDEATTYSVDEWELLKTPAGSPGPYYRALMTKSQNFTAPTKVAAKHAVPPLKAARLAAQSKDSICGNAFMENPKDLAREKWVTGKLPRSRKQMMRVLERKRRREAQRRRQQRL